MLAFPVPTTGIPRQSAQALPLILEPGTFHGEEIPELPETPFTGLFRKGDTLELAEARVVIEPSFDEIIDSPGQMTGKKVTINGPGEPLFAISGNPMERIGAVEAVKQEFAANLLESHIEFSFLGTHYKMQREGGASEVEGFTGASLRLYRGENSQVIYTISEPGENPNWNLLWAGDLDGDKQLDLYMDLSRHYNVSERRLFLSSGAGRGKLVREIAVLRLTGC